MRLGFPRITCTILILAYAPGLSANDFEWNWREARALALTSENSLRNATISEKDRQSLMSALLDQLPRDPDNPELASDEQRQKAALDTGIAMIDLNGDGTPEVIAQGTVDCSPTGNCPFWIFQNSSKGYHVILKAFGQTFTVQHDAANGYLDVVIGMHSSATEQELKVYTYKNGRYRKTACFVADWEILEGHHVRELKEPRITPCTSP